ncbi:MAG: TerB N-terminal domain-containing protein [Paenisporosarcina sp.]
MNNKSKKIGYILAFFLGGFGAHAFYYRKYAKGTMYILFSWTAVPVFLGWIDMFFIKAWQNELEAALLPQNSNSNQKEPKNIPTKQESKENTMDDLMVKNRLEWESLPFSNERPLKPVATDALKRDEHESVKQVVRATKGEQQIVDSELKIEPVIIHEEAVNLANLSVNREDINSLPCEPNNEIEESVMPTPTTVPALEGNILERFAEGRKSKNSPKGKRTTVQPINEPDHKQQEIKAVLSTLNQVQKQQEIKTVLSALNQLQQRRQVEEAVSPADKNAHHEEKVLADAQTTLNTTGDMHSHKPYLEDVIAEVVIENDEVHAHAAIDAEANYTATVEAVLVEAEGAIDVAGVVQEVEPALPELTIPSPPEEPSVNIAEETQPKKGLFAQASKLKRKIEDSLKQLPDVNVPQLNRPFYNEDAIILDKYRHIETPRDILRAIEQIKRGSYSPDNDSYSISFSHSGTQFIKQSLKHATKRGVESPEIPLHAYWTTFDSLNLTQEKWYFYWREQVLNGKYPDVDLSYIILFVYELLNYSFNQKAAFNISMMALLHDNYIDRIPKVETYIGQWTADMLREVGENELLEEWESPSGQIYMMPLYKQLKEKHDDLPRISFTTWKPYIQNYNETMFFTSHKHKIYKNFKESFPLLQSVSQEQGESLIDRYFEIREESNEKHLYSSAVMGRETEVFHIKVKRIVPTARINDEVTALFRLTENVTRLLNGEKRQIKVDESFLPEGFKEMMMERFTPVPKEAKKRFTVVQKAENLEGYGSIPPPPEETPAPVPEQRPVIEFNPANIKAFQEETEELIAIFDERSTEEEEVPGIIGKVETGAVATYLGEYTDTSIETNTDTTTNGTVNEEVEGTYKGQPSTETLTPKVETSIPTGDMSTPTDIFLAFGGGGSVDGEEDFLESLTLIEKEFLVQFENGVYNQNAANSFLKQKGIMMGMFISEINEKANEYLGDNFLESQADEIAVYEEFEQCILTLKETN